jgi:LytS/YehU family sensor histidine kinase
MSRSTSVNVQHRRKFRKEEVGADKTITPRHRAAALWRSAEGHVEVAPEADRGLVPPLLLQPLAENAVRHGIATLVEGGDITIAVRRKGERIEVEVENPYDTDGQRRGTGVGLTNVRARLDASYHGRASLKVLQRSVRVPDLAARCHVSSRHLHRLME